MVVEASDFIYLTILDHVKRIAREVPMPKRRKWFHRRRKKIIERMMKHIRDAGPPKYDVDVQAQSPDKVIVNIAYPKSIEYITFDLVVKDPPADAQGS